MFYAYILNNKKGIVEDWENCKALVNGVSGAKCNIDDKETLKLVEVVSKLRDNFKGKIEHISGDINPADLGFHK